MTWLDLHRLRSCLIDNATSFELVETSSLMIVIAPFWLLLAVCIAPVILYRYQKAVLLFMNRHRDDASEESQIPAPHLEQSRNQFIGKPEEVTAAVDTRLVSARWQVVVMAFLYILMLAILITLSYETANLIDFAETLGGAVIILAMLLLPLLTTLLFSHKFAFYMGSILILAIFYILFDEYVNATSQEEREETWYVLAVIPYCIIFYFSLCGQTLKNIVPYTAITFACTALFVFLSVFSVSLFACGVSLDTGSEVFGILFLLALLMALFAFPLLAIRCVSTLYKKKQLSDRQLVICCWFILASLSSMILMLEPNEDTVALIPLAWITLPVLLITLILYLEFSKNETLLPNPPRLLVLRVFKQRASAQAAIQQLINSWREIGPVFMIAGPDLVSSSAEPDEIYLYLTRRIESLFLTDKADCKQAVENLELSPDPDGRYRLNEFFCFDSIWESVANHIIQRSDYVILDLREFTVARLGTAKEIVFLTDNQALPKTLILVETEEKIQEMISSISELTGVTITEKQFFCLDKKEPKRLFRQMLSLGSLNVQDYYKIDEQTVEPLLTDQAYREQRLLMHHQQTLDKHTKTPYTFNYALMFLGVFGFFLGYGAQFLAPLYLKLKGVSWSRCFKVAGVQLLFALVSTIVIPVLPYAEAESASLQQQLLVLVMGFAFILASVAYWIPISRRANRWIAESREPTCSALEYIRELEQRSLMPHQKALDKHTKTPYTFNYALMFLGVFGLLVGYGAQFLAPLYLKLKGVSWSRCFKVAGIQLLFGIVYEIVMRVLLYAEAEGASLQQELLVLVMVFAFTIAGLAYWIPISRRANRWIAESKEPTRNAKEYIREHEPESTL